MWVNRREQDGDERKVSGRDAINKKGVGRAKCVYVQSALTARIPFASHTSEIPTHFVRTNPFPPCQKSPESHSTLPPSHLPQLHPQSQHLNTPSRPTSPQIEHELIQRHPIEDELIDPHPRKRTSGFHLSSNALSSWKTALNTTSEPPVPDAGDFRFVG